MKTVRAIIWVVPDLSGLGGSEYMTAAFCRLLRASGIQVHIVTRCIHDTWKNALEDAEVTGQINIVEVHSTNTIDFVDAIDSIAAQSTISLMQVMPLESFCFDLIRHKEYGFPVCGLEPTDLSDHCWWLPENIQQDIHSLDGLLVLNPDAANTARNVHRFNKPIQIIPNALMNDRYKRTDRHFPSATFGCISRLSQEKGLEYLLGAFSLLLKRHPPVTLSIWGEGEDDERLHHQCRMLGIADHVFFHGAFHPLEDSFSISDSAEIFISSSLFEGCGIAMLEQAYRSKSLIGTATCGMKWVLGEDYPGLVPIADTNALARMMELTLMDAAFRQQLKVLVQKRFHSIFDPSHTRDQLISFYTGLLDRVQIFNE